MFISSYSKPEDLNKYNNLSKDSKFKEILEAFEDISHVSRNRLAEMAGISDTAIIDWESGMVKNPSKEKAVRLCWALCLSRSESEFLLRGLGLCLNPAIPYDAVYLQIISLYEKKTGCVDYDRFKSLCYLNFLADADDILREHNMEYNYN